MRWCVLRSGTKQDQELIVSSFPFLSAVARDDVDLTVDTACNKLERTQQMLQVSEELLATRTESSLVVQQELTHGAALSSQEDLAIAHEFDAKTLLLQSQLEYTQANEESVHAIGQTPQ
jgi:hypothetical protein